MLYYIRKLKEIHNILSINRLWRTRLYEIGIVIKDFCLYFGVTGLLSRSIKIIIDARFTGYEFYEELNYSIFYSSFGVVMKSLSLVLLFHIILPIIIETVINSFILTIVIEYPAVRSK